MGEVKIEGEFENEGVIKTSATKKKWRKSEETIPSQVQNVKKCDDVMQRGGKPMFKIFFILFRRND